MIPALILVWITVLLLCKLCMHMRKLAVESYRLLSRHDNPIQWWCHWIGARCMDIGVGGIIMTAAYVTYVVITVEG